MNKILNILFFFCLSFGLNAQEIEKDSIKVEGWKKSGITSFIVNQTAFSNWISGGENSVAATLTVDYLSLIHI